MRRLAFSILLATATLPLGACGGSSPSQPAQPTSANGRPAPDVCAGDPWLAQLFGEQPTISSTMRLDGMRRSRALGGAAQRLERIEMDYLYELGSVRSASAETYEWRTTQPNVPASRATVLRQAFGDPRALAEGNVRLYGEPVRLSAAATEYPPSPDAASRDLPFRPRGGRTLFTFSDGTWVRVDAWMAQRVRDSFARGGAPPLPIAPPDVAWEICTRGSELANRPSGVWSVAPERAVVHILADRDPDIDMFFRFASPALAIRAQGEQQVRCSQQPAGPKNDKGIFDFTPPCAGVASSTIEGSMLHYAVRSGR